jgi:hypothetical protein
MAPGAVPVSRLCDHGAESLALALIKRHEQIGDAVYVAPGDQSPESELEIDVCISHCSRPLDVHLAATRGGAHPIGIDHRSGQLDRSPRHGGVARWFVGSGSGSHLV